MQAWAESTGNEYTDFFKKVAPSEATLLVRLGKLSPWAIYLAESADHLWQRLSEEQADMIMNIIDPKIWRAKFQIKKEDCNFVREMLSEAGI
jgi:hypothetical protein